MEARRLRTCLVFAILVSAVSTQSSLYRVLSKKVDSIKELVKHDVDILQHQLDNVKPEVLAEVRAMMAEAERNASIGRGRWGRENKWEVCERRIGLERTARLALEEKVDAITQRRVSKVAEGSIDVTNTRTVSRLENKMHLVTEAFSKIKTKTIQCSESLELLKVEMRETKDEMARREEFFKETMRNMEDQMARLREHEDSLVLPPSVWASWQPWSTCSESRSCGQGQRHRSRECPTGGSCEGSDRESESCDIRGFRFQVGDRVRVKPSVGKPAYGWGRVKHGDIGTVTRIRNTGRLYVDFPAQSGWLADISDMERVCVP